MDKLNDLNLSNKIPQKPSKKAVILVIIVFAALIFFFVKLILEGSSTIGKYTKEDLPQNFEYSILKDESNKNLEKNQLEVLINQKLTIGQLATLADKLYKTKDEERRFYIGYVLKGNENSQLYWANSDFDPELEIIINSSTSEEDNKMLLEAKRVDGNITGIFDEKEVTASLYTLFDYNGKNFIKTTYKNGQTVIDEMIKTNDGGGVKLVEKISSNGEYYILKNNILNFYNKENVVFASAQKVE